MRGLIRSVRPFPRGQLREAVRLGFRDSNYIGADPDLESLRGDAGYKKLMEEEITGSPTKWWAPGCHW